MSSEFGKNIKISIFGESHGECIGAVIDGLPAGEEINEVELLGFMARRAPGGFGKLATTRKEADTPKLVSGVLNGKTTGAPLCVIIKNTNKKSADYENLRNIPRLGHADYTAFVKFSGFADMRGGGHFSGRLTAPICAVGGIALQILKRRGININARIAEIAGENYSEEKAREIIENLGGDSVGGVIECTADGVPEGLGGGIFGLESKLSYALFGIPGVKGVEFGSGFAGAKLRGSQNNDEFIVENDKIVTKTNNHGGLLGGITTGMPLVFKIALKPTPSIALEQNSVDLSACENTKLKIEGRHDPCIAIRAVPVAEAYAALVLLDEMI